VVAFFSTVNMKFEDQFSVRLLHSDSVEVYTQVNVVYMASSMVVQQNMK